MCKRCEDARALVDGVGVPEGSADVVCSSPGCDGEALVRVSASEDVVAMLCFGCLIGLASAGGAKEMRDLVAAGAEPSVKLATNVGGRVRRRILDIVEVLP